jgi:chaperonin GroES
MKTIRPLHDVLVVRRTTPEAVSKGGIFIPEDAKETSTTALVVAVGPGDRSKSGYRMPVDVKAGDTVLLGKYAGTGQELTVEGEKVLLVRSGDVLAVVGEAGPSLEAQLCELIWPLADANKPESAVETLKRLLDEREQLLRRVREQAA